VGQLDRERVEVAHEQRRRAGAVHRRQCLEVREARADRDDALAREDQRALDERLDDLDLGRLQAVPEHDVAGGQRELAAALADELDALAHELEADDLLGVVAHDGGAAVADEGGRRAVDEGDVAEAPACDAALERARGPVRRADVEGEVGRGQDVGPRGQAAGAGQPAEPPALGAAVRRALRTLVVGVRQLPSLCVRSQEVRANASERARASARPGGGGQPVASPPALETPPPGR
jgi:hypothetical protein